MLSAPEREGRCGHRSIKIYGRIIPQFPQVPGATVTSSYVTRMHINVYSVISGQAVRGVLIKRYLKKNDYSCEDNLMYEARGFIY